MSDYVQHLVDEAVPAITASLAEGPLTFHEIRSYFHTTTPMAILERALQKLLASGSVTLNGRFYASR